MIEILILLAELIFTIFIFALFNWLVGITFKQMKRMSFFQGKDERLAKQRRTISRLLIFLCVALCLLMIGLNGLVIYQGQSVEEFQLELIGSIPTQFWVTLITGIAQSVLLLTLVKFSLPSIYSVLDWGCERTQNYDDITANDQSIADFFSYLKTSLTNSLWMVSCILCAKFLQVPEVILKYLYIPLKAYLIITAGFLVIEEI